MNYFKNTSDGTLTDLTNLTLIEEEYTFYSTVTFDFDGKLRNQHPNFIATCLCKVLSFKVILSIRSGFDGFFVVTRVVTFSYIQYVILTEYKKTQDKLQCHSIY